MDVIFYQSDNLIEVDELTDVATGAYINDATIVMTLVNAVTGANITGQTWPQLLGYVTGSNGKYRATVLNGIVVVPGDRCTAKLTITTLSGLKRYMEKSLKVITGS